MLAHFAEPGPHDKSAQQKERKKNTWYCSELLLVLR